MGHSTSQFMSGPGQGADWPWLGFRTHHHKLELEAGWTKPGYSTS